MANGLEEFIRGDRLLQIGGGALVQGLDNMALVGIGRDHDHRAGRKVALDIFEDIQAGVILEHDVEQGDID